MIKLYCAHGINQPRSFKFQENKEMRTFNNYNLKKFNEIRKTPSVNNYYLVNICQNKNKEKPHIQNRKNKLAIDTDIINNNIPFQDKYYSRVESKSNVVPKELILNIKSSNKKLLKCLGCDYSNQSSNILTEPKCEYLKNKTKQKKVINFNYEPINSCSTRNSLSKKNLSNNAYVSPFKTMLTIPKIERYKLNMNKAVEAEPSIITINLKENDILSINYISNSSPKGKKCVNKGILNTLKESNDISRKNIYKFNNKSSCEDIQVKNNLDTYNSKDKFDNNINNKIIKIKQDLSFVKYLFAHINKIRTNPKSFIKYIEQAQNNITKDKKGNSIYKGNLKVALSKGKEAFDKAISSLKKMKPMNPLLFKKELCIDIPTNENEFKSGDYLKNKIKEKMNKGILIEAFWRDIIKDPEINFLLMIVDDNPINLGAKRKDILNPKMKYIGINSAYLGPFFVSYLVLSSE
jgi:hypothetical protein